MAWNRALSEWKGSSLSDLWVEMWKRCSMMVCFVGFELVKEKGVEYGVGVVGYSPSRQTAGSLWITGDRREFGESGSSGLGETS